MDAYSTSPNGMYIRVNKLSAKVKVSVANLIPKLKFGSTIIGINNGFLEISAGFYLDTNSSGNNIFS